MKPFNRREMLRLIAVLAGAWLVILIVVARWQRHAAVARGGEPALVHYPGTEGIEEQTSPNLGFRKYWFTLKEDYPSTSVYRFYRNEMKGQGWRPMGAGHPRWGRQPAGDGTRDLFYAVWVSPDNVFRLELEMMSLVRAVRQEKRVVGEEREPGIQVYVTLRRELAASIFAQPRDKPAQPGALGPAGTGTR